MVNVLLVGGASAFGLILAKKLRAVGAKVFIFDTQQADLDDVEFVLGSLDNSLLIRRIVSECQASVCSLSALLQNKVHFRFLNKGILFSQPDENYELYNFR
jgi:short-subunit dehydrogenase involved in D-alanine esterification of teichoic acids